MYLLKKTILCIAAVAISIFSFTAMAADDANDAKLKTFSDACVASWMKGSSQSEDNKLFGERFCGCAGNKLIPVLDRKGVTEGEIDAAKKQVSAACISEAILQQTVHSFKDDDNVTEADLKSTCLKSWDLIFTNGLNDGQKKFTDSFCSCASSPLAELTGHEDKLSDEEYNTKVGTISAGCDKVAGAMPQ